MPISLICQSCKREFDAADDAIGQPAHCPKCGSATTVPQPQAAKKGIPLATEAQLDYARRLGIEFPGNVNRREISDLIDDARAKLEKERFRRLDELERREAAIAENCGLANATPSQIIDALGNRGVTAVLITLQGDGSIDFSDLTGVHFDISFTDDMTEQDMEAVVFTAATMFADKRRK